MRIIAGRWADRDLISPGGRVRPTAEAVRSSALDWVADHVAGARVLDLCAGTGALGLEALSRGASSCDFVENGAEALHALKANVAKLRATRQTRIFKRDVRAFIASIRDPYDLVFADPPYVSALADRIAEAWLERPFSRILLIEHDPSRTLPRAPAGSPVQVRHRRVGEAGLTRYRGGHRPPVAG